MTKSWLLSHCQLKCIITIFSCFTEPQVFFHKFKLHQLQSYLYCIQNYLCQMHRFPGVWRALQMLLDLKHLPGSWHQTLFCLRQLVRIPFCLAEKKKKKKYRICVKENENNIYIYIYIYIYITLKKVLIGEGSGCRLTCTLSTCTLRHFRFREWCHLHSTRIVCVAKIKKTASDITRGSVWACKCWACKCKSVCSQTLLAYFAGLSKTSFNAWHYLSTIKACSSAYSYPRSTSYHALHIKHVT